MEYIMMIFVSLLLFVYFYVGIGLLEGDFQSLYLTIGFIAFTAIVSILGIGLLEGIVTTSIIAGCLVITRHLKC